jgi:hypothetical protein
MTRRNCVFVALSSAVGHELVFRHYTNKVVVGKCSDGKSTKSQNNNSKKKSRKI